MAEDELARLAKIFIDDVDFYAKHMDKFSTPLVNEMVVTALDILDERNDQV